MKRTNHRHIKLLGLIALVLLAIPSCVSELDLTSFSFERSVVVDGVFTDEEKIQTVRLSYTTPVGLDSLAPLKGARVWVEDNLGAVINFTEQSPGAYSTLDVVKGIEGRSYKLAFVLENGKRYESTAEPLVKSPAIEISQRFAELPSSELNQNEQGLQFFIDTPDGVDNAQFFRYEWNDASRTTVPWPARFRAQIKGTDNGHPNARNIEITREDRDLETCYKFGFSNGLILGNTLELSENSILDQHVRFASMERLNFVERYSIEVTQYAVSQQAFNYYRTLKEFNESNGSLFDTQQGIVLGNIKSLGDEEEIVLGYFEVSGISRQRKFYNPNEFNEEFTSAFLDFSHVCSAGEIIIVRDLELFPSRYNGPWTGGDIPLSIDFFSGQKVTFSSPLVIQLLGEVFIYDFVITGVFISEDSDILLGTGEAYLAPGTCIYCIRHGEISEKPTYWID